MITAFMMTAALIKINKNNAGGASRRFGIGRKSGGFGAKKLSQRILKGFLAVSQGFEPFYRRLERFRGQIPKKGFFI